MSSASPSSSPASSTDQIDTYNSFDAASTHSTDANSSSLSEEDPGVAPRNPSSHPPPDPALDEKFINSLQAQDRGHALITADVRCLFLHLAARTNRLAIASAVIAHRSKLEITNASGRTPLSIAAGAGHVAVALALLDGRADPNTKDKHGRTPLWWAARNGHAEAVRMLLDAPRIDCESPRASEAMLAAAANGHTGTLEIFLTEKSRVETNTDSPQGRTALSWAARGGHTATVAFLLKLGSGAEIQGTHRRTALHWAAAGGYQDAMAKLLSFGTDVESPDLGGRTPLSWAAGNGHIEAVELILEEAEVDVNAQDNSGRTPLSWAAEGGHQDVVEALIGLAKKQELDKERKLMRYKYSTPLEFALEVGAKKHAASLLAEYGLDIDLPDDEDRTPLSWAAGSGYKSVTVTLIEHGAEVEAEDGNGRTPLWWAAANGHVATVEALLEQDGVNPQRQDNNGETALSRAQFGGFAEIVRLLGGAEVDQPEATADTNYDGLLLWAVNEGHEAVVELLLSEGADPNVQGAYNSRPLCQAAANGNVVIARLLVDSGADIDAVQGESRVEWTPLSHAAAGGHREMVEYLVTTGSDLNCKTEMGSTPLTLAIQRGHQHIVAQLLRHGSDLCGSDILHTELKSAVDRKYPDIAKMLIDHIIEFLHGQPYREDQRPGLTRPLTEYVDYDGRTLLSYAAKIGYMSAAERLLSMPHVGVNHHDDWDHTPLAYAVERGHEEMVELLLAHNAEIGCTSIRGAGFLVSYEKGHEELAARLLEKGTGTLSEGTWALDSDHHRALLSLAAQLGHLSIVDFLVSKFESPPDLSGPSQLAAESGHIDVVEYLLDRGASVISKGDEYSSGRPGILSKAAINGHEAIVQMLLSRGADPNGEQDHERLGPLSRAAREGQVGVAKLLLRHGADPNLPLTADYDGSSSPLVIAAQHGHLNMVELLLAEGADPSWDSDSLSKQKERDWRVPYYTGNSALSAAIEKGYKDIVKALLDSGANMNDDHPPLATAIIADETAIAELLLANGASFQLGSYEETPLSVASRYGNEEAVKLFLERGADIEGKDKSGRTPLSLAKTEAVAKILIDAGAEINSEDTYGRSPLCWATDLGIVKLLIEAKANVNSGQSVGWTPLITAAKQVDAAKVQLLLQNGADVNVNVKDKHSRTPLLIAAKKRGDWYGEVFEMVKLLLDHGADPEAKDAKGLTALSWAAWHHHLDIVKLLLERGASLAAFVGYNPQTQEGYFSLPAWDTNSVEEADQDLNWDDFEGKSLSSLYKRL